MASWVESKVAFFFVFSQIWMKGYFRLGYTRLGKDNDCPSGLEPLTGRKATLKIRRNPQLQILPMTQKYSMPLRMKTFVPPSLKVKNYSSLPVAGLK